MPPRKKRKKEKFATLSICPSCGKTFSAIGGKGCPCSASQYVAKSRDAMPGSQNSTDSLPLPVVTDSEEDECDTKQLESGWAASADQERFHLWVSDNGRWEASWGLNNEDFNGSEYSAAWESVVPLSFRGISSTLGAAANVRLTMSDQARKADGLFGRDVNSGRCEGVSNSIIKSAIQKNIRRCRPAAAARCTLELLRRDPSATLRRLVVIVFEDAILHPLLPVLTWLMMACGRPGFQLTSGHVNVATSVAYDLAAVRVRDNVDMNAVTPVHTRNLHDLTPTERTIVRSITARAAFGGMKYDILMLVNYAQLWAQRFRTRHRRLISIAEEAANRQEADDSRRTPSVPSVDAEGMTVLNRREIASASPCAKVEDSDDTGGVGVFEANSFEGTRGTRSMPEEYHSSKRDPVECDASGNVALLLNKTAQRGSSATSTPPSSIHEGLNASNRRGRSGGTTPCYPAQGHSAFENGGDCMRTAGTAPRTCVTGTCVAGNFVAGNGSEAAKEELQFPPKVRPEDDVVGSRGEHESGSPNRLSDATRSTTSEITSEATLTKSSEKESPQHQPLLDAPTLHLGVEPQRADASGWLQFISTVYTSARCGVPDASVRRATCEPIRLSDIPSEAVDHHCSNMFSPSCAPTRIWTTQETAMVHAVAAASRCEQRSRRLCQMDRTPGLDDSVS
eukprot:Rmarinus@m.29218